MKRSTRLVKTLMIAGLATLAGLSVAFVSSDASAQEGGAGVKASDAEGGYGYEFSAIRTTCSRVFSPNTVKRTSIPVIRFCW